MQQAVVHPWFVDEEFARWLFERDPERDWAAAAETAQRLAPTLLGLSVPAATALARAGGVSVRVVRGDGAPRFATTDRRPNRINVDVSLGVIVAADVY